MPASPSDRAAALGSVDSIRPLANRRLLKACDDFAPIPAPRPGDWLDGQPSRGQTFSEFAARRPVLGADRRFVAVMRLGPWPDTMPSLALVCEYVGAFFQRPVKRLKAQPISESIRRRTQAGDTHEQLHVEDIFRILRRRKPAGAIALVAITACDLYPSDDWNYVFGKASLDGAYGVCSYSRFDPAFFDEPANPRLLLRRALNVTVHETMHMLGVPHCVFYSCRMQGSNSLDESDRSPFDICPVCLRKLVHRLGSIDLGDRYRSMLSFYRNQPGFDKEVAWLERRLKSL